jgi:hypothetical protein
MKEGKKRKGGGVEQRQKWETQMKGSGRMKVEEDTLFPRTLSRREVLFFLLAVFTSRHTS